MRTSGDQGALDAPMLSQGTNQARHGSRKRPDPPGLGDRRAGTCHDPPGGRSWQTDQPRTCRPVRCPPIDEDSRKAPVVRPGLVQTRKRPEGSLDAPILSQSMRRAIIRKRETRNQKD
jgi:hypothetical protein